MPNKRKLPGGTVGWTGSTMRENQQEDIFLPCDDRLVAVNVGPDYHYGSLVYDTNKNNEYDADRSAWLQSAFRVLKKPLGGPNAIGFQLYFTGNGETKGGWFVDIGDGSTTKKNVSTGVSTSSGSGMVATGGGPVKPSTLPQNTTYTTTNAGASGGVIIGQGSYNDGGPFHVGNRADKHNNGFDADGNPINSLHIDTNANFYKNQAEDGPLRFEDTYQTGQDQSIIVPVHLGWTGRDWAWWSTSYFYNPDPTPTPRTPTPYTFVPVETNPTTTPTPGYHPHPQGPTIRVPVPSIDIPTIGPGNPGYVPISSGGAVNPPGIGPGEDTGPATFTGGDIGEGGVTSGGGGATAGGTPQPGDIIGYTDSGIPIRQPPPPTPPDYYKTPPPDPTPPGGGQPPSVPTGPTAPHIPPDIPVYTVPDLPIIQDYIGPNSTPPMNTVATTGAIASSAVQFVSQNYNPTAPSGGLFSPSAGAPVASIAKSSNSDPATGQQSSFGAQGGAIQFAPGTGPSPSPPASPSPSPAPTPTPTPTPSPTPASNTGGQGDPWDYTQTPRDTGDKSGSTKKKSKFKRGTASGGICYHPSETDLRDIPVGLVPPNTTMSTTTITVGPNAYFAAGVPELVNGSIKSGYRWGVDSTTGDLVFYSISFSQPPIEAVRFCNTGQVIRWRSTENVYGELTHANTANRQYTFPDTSGRVVISTNVIGDGAGSILLNAHTGGTGPTGTTPYLIKIRAADEKDYWVQGYQ